MIVRDVKGVISKLLEVRVEFRYSYDGFGHNIEVAPGHRHTLERIVVQVHQSNRKQEVNPCT